MKRVEGGNLPQSSRFQIKRPNPKKNILKKFSMKRNKKQKQERRFAILLKTGTA